MYVNMKRHLLAYWMICNTLLSVSLVSSQACKFGDVTRGRYIPWYPYSNDLLVTTDSVLGSAESITLDLYNGLDTVTGKVEVGFPASGAQYMLYRCFSEWRDIPGNLPPGVNKIWRFSYDPATKNFQIYCNDVLVVDIVMSAGTCPEWSKSGNQELWERAVNMMQFSDSSDTASEQYCLPGKRYANMFLFRRRKLIKTQKVGKEVSIICKLIILNFDLKDPDSPYNIEWYKINQETGEENKIEASNVRKIKKINHRRSNYKLRFSNPKREDSGTYRCSFSQLGVKASSEITIEFA